MHEYQHAVESILEYGTRKENRTGVDTISLFNVNCEYDLRLGFPLLTTKAMSWKNIVIELLWFLSGDTRIGFLQKHGCRFWDAWADSSGRVPSAYGHFWRQFPVQATRDSSDHNIDGAEYVGRNDQIGWLIDTLKRDPSSRRMVVSAWAPGNAQTSKLPPCHCLFVVNVQNLPDVEEEWDEETRKNEVGKPALCIHLTQRSCDMALGVPYNIASYALLAHLLSRFSGIPVGKFGHSMVDAHVYTAKPDGSKAEFDHIPGLQEQLNRTPRRLPMLRISEEIRSLADVELLMREDTDTIMRCFMLEGYDPHPAINFKVAV